MSIIAEACRYAACAIIIYTVITYAVVDLLALNGHR